MRVDGSNGTLDLCPIKRFDGDEPKLTPTLKAAGGFAAGRHEADFGVQTDRYAAQLKELAASVRGERPNAPDFDRDLRVHEVTLRACGIGHAGRVTRREGRIPTRPQTARRPSLSDR